MLHRNKFVFDNEYKAKELNLTINKHGISKDEKEFCDEIEMLIDAEKNISDEDVRQDESCENRSAEEEKETAKMDGDLVENVVVVTTNCAKNDVNMVKRDINTDEKSDICHSVCDENHSFQRDTLCEEQVHVAEEKRKDVNGRKELLKSIDIKNIFDKKSFSSQLSSLVNRNKTVRGKTAIENTIDHENRSKNTENMNKPVEIADSTVLEKLLFDLPFAYNAVKINAMQQQHQLELQKKELTMIKAENTRIIDSFLKEFRKISEHIISGAHCDTPSKEMKNVQMPMNLMAETLETLKEAIKYKEEVVGLKDELCRIRGENEEIRREKQWLVDKLEQKEILDRVSTRIEMIGEEMIKANNNSADQRNILRKCMQTEKNCKKVYRDRTNQAIHHLNVLRTECDVLRTSLIDVKQLVDSIVELRRVSSSREIMQDEHVIITIKNEYESKIRCFQDEITRLKKTKRVKSMKPDNSDVWNVFEN
ncbi:hypothetical protein THOM_2390 [Trachipleistophora hominis]|uniref:Uncharacterized protein n=1 Tax=Trachipleistophora hominis TaxID=72359 RepID=L7JVB0_TRAHO|nr:hypothetical protein THOM_2390 [Trachipleistophora hominis]